MWIVNASGWLFKKNSITKHGNMNVKFVNQFPALTEAEASYVSNRQKLLKTTELN